MAFLLIGMTTGNILPTYRRRRRRPTSDRGLPPDDVLAQLAEAYLAEQYRLWPDLATLDLLQPRTSESIQEMVDDYKHRHRCGRKVTKVPSCLAKYVKKLAGAYSRFSCDNSKTTSILDQMVNSLRKAAERKEFIPWQYIFGDYSVSGLDSTRQGYNSYKSVLKDEEQLISTTYIDDFSRASREELEWWKLAYRSKRLGKNVVGASDGFDLNSDDSDFKMSVYGLLSKLFIKSLRQKVTRGMKGGHRRRRCLGKLPFGFTRKEVTNEAGEVVRNPDGTAVHQPCWDPVNLDHAKGIFEMFCIERLSIFEITKQLNAKQVADWDGWSETGVKKILSNPAYIGVFIWNRYHTEFDPEEESWVRVPNPHNEWERWYDPALAIIPMEWYRGTRRLLSQARRNSPLTGRKRTRNQRSATTLFSGTLYCEYCKSEIKLVRSTSKYKQLGCLNGPGGKHKCQLRSSKSLRTIEDCLLKYVSKAILNDAAVGTLVESANAYLEQERHRPRTDITPLRARKRDLEGKIKKQVIQYERVDKEHLRHAIDARIEELQTALNAVEKELAMVARREAPIPPPLDAERIKGYLADLRDLVNRSTPASAEAIRELTGVIWIHQEAIPGRVRGARWVARFTPQFLRFLAAYTRREHYPDSLTLEYLSNRIWTNPTEAAVEIYDIPKYEELADEFRHRHQEGETTNRLALEYGISWVEADSILSFALTGQRPRHTKKSRSGTNSKKMRYRDIADEVVHCFEKNGRRFDQIARDMGVSGGTVRRAYYWKRPERIGQDHESLVRLDKSVFDTIKSLLDAGQRDQCMIAKKAGCSTGTVRREMIRLGLPTKHNKPKAASMNRVSKRKSAVNPRAIVDDVVRMKDTEKKTFSEIAVILAAGFRTVQKAYDLGRPDLVAAAVASGEPTRRARNSRIGSERKKQIATLAADGATIEEIMTTTGCSKSTAVRAVAAYGAKRRAY